MLGLFILPDMQDIITPDSLNINDITYGPVKKNDNGGKSIYVLHNKKPILMQLPTMFSAPYGLSAWENKDGKTSYTLDLSFQGIDERPKLKEFYEKIENLDKKVIDSCYENEWLQLDEEANSKQVVKSNYSSKLGFSKDKVTKKRDNKYPPKFTLKLLKNNDDKFSCKVFDDKKQEIELTKDNTKSAKITSILKLGGIWIVNQKFGLTWNVVQLKVQPPSKITGYAFKSVQDDIGDSSDNEEDESDDDIDKNTSSLEKTNIRASSDEDDLEK